MAATYARDVGADPVRARAVRGLGAVATLQIVGAATNFLTLLALARLLSPRDFGIAAVASLITGIVGIVGDFGLGAAVIQRTDRVEEALATGATLRFVLALILFGATVFVAPFAALFFSTPEATDPTRVVAILFLLGGAGFIPLTRLAKNLEFGVIVKAALSSSLVSGATSVSLAWAGFGFWSIVIASVVASCVNLGVLYALRPWPLRFRYNHHLASELLGFGKHMFLATTFIFLVMNLDSATIAYSLGPVALGYYALAYKWAGVPVNFLSKVASQVMTPAYVLLRDSRDRLRKGFIETIQMIVVVSLPVYLILFMLAEEFVTVALGETWLPIVTPLRILCLLGMLRGITDPGGYLFTATGNARTFAFSTGIHLAVVGSLMYPGLVLGGIPGVAAAVVAAYVANTLVVHRLVRRILGPTWRDVGRALRGILLAGLPTIPAVLSIKMLLPPSAITFALAILAGTAAYLLTLHLLEGNLLVRYLRQALDARRTP